MVGHAFDGGVLITPQRGLSNGLMLRVHVARTASVRRRETTVPFRLDKELLAQAQSPAAVTGGNQRLMEDVVRLRPIDAQRIWTRVEGSADELMQGADDPPFPSDIPKLNGPAKAVRLQFDSRVGEVVEIVERNWRNDETLRRFSRERGLPS